MSLFVENRSAVPVPNGWRIETRRLALTACDIEAAETLARIVTLPRVFEPYYVEPASNLWVKSCCWQGGTKVQQGRSVWELSDFVAGFG
jgi:hypothetical protein